MQDLAKAIVAKIPLLTLVLSAVVAYLLVPATGSFPMVPFFVLFTCLGTLVFLARIDRKWFDTVLYVGILLLSGFLLIRANEVTQFINFLFIIVFGSLLILPVTKQHTLINLLLTPVNLVKEALTEKNIFPYSLSSINKYNKLGLFNNLLLSALVTLLFLGVTIPLLASSNPFFDQLVQNVFKYFNLTQLLSYFGDQMVFNVSRLCIFLFFAYVIPRVLSASALGLKTQEINIGLPVNYLVPKVAMGILLIVFFITQAQLYFAPSGVLQSMGYTNSRLANEVFFQVTFVAFIIFFLTYLDRGRKTWNRILTYFLILESFFLVGIAFKSVYDYSFLWGLTEKRLWGYAAMSWLTGALLLFVYYYSKKIPDFRFFQLIITYSGIVLLSVNFANFDYLISHYSKARTQSGTDYAYLAKLSPDTRYYKETLDNLVTQIEKSGIREQEKITAAYRLLFKMESIKRKYSGNTPVNSFNFSEYKEYTNIRHTDTQAYRNRILFVDQKYHQQEKVDLQQQ